MPSPLSSRSTSTAAIWPTRSRSGTGAGIDTDKYDRYYKHLILWDKDSRKLAGAYRLGIGREIYERYGVEGFYTHTLFKYSKEFTEKLPECIELGRSFLSVEYKKEALPLMLLIKGLLFTVIRYSNCKYLFGPASITSWLPPFYRSLIIYGLSMCTPGSPECTVTPRTPFKYDFLRVDPALLLKGKDILAYNVDKEFNYCVDGMIFLDIDKVPRSEVVLLTKGSDNPETLLERFKQ